MSAIAAASFSRERDTITTFAPFLASWMAADRPIPSDPPVISTV